MIFYENSLDYKVFLEIQKFLDSWEKASARKLALSLWLKENSTKTIQRKLKQFEDLGFIEKSETWRISKITRAWKVHFWIEEVKFSENKTFPIPLIWEIACGNPIEAIEEEKERINISSEFISWNPEKYFLLQARWDSMDKEGIENGDMVLIKQQSYAENNQIVAALIDDSATLKRYRKNEKGIISLNPSSYNETHKPIIMSEEFLVLGVYVRNMGRI